MNKNLFGVPRLRGRLKAELQTFEAKPLAFYKSLTGSAGVN